MLFNKNGILLYLLICHLFYLFVWLCWILVVEPKISLHPARIFIAVNGLPSRGIASCDTHSGLVAPQQVGFLVPWLGIEPKSPALQGGFLTTGPLGKYLHWLFTPFHRPHQMKSPYSIDCLPWNVFQSWPPLSIRLYFPLHFRISSNCFLGRPFLCSLSI